MCSYLLLLSTQEVLSSIPKPTGVHFFLRPPYFFGKCFLYLPNTHSQQGIVGLRGVVLTVLVKLKGAVDKYNIISYP